MDQVGGEGQSASSKGHFFGLQALVKKIGLGEAAVKFFGLYQQMEHDFSKPL